MCGDCYDNSYKDIKKCNFRQRRKESNKGNLHKAVSSNNLKDVQSLLKNGVNVNKENVHGDTPLSVALQEVSENVEVIKELLNYGASLKMMKKYYEDPLHLAIRNQKSPEVIQELVKYGANVNAKNGLGVKPIFIALFQSEVNVQLVRELLKNGASVKIRDIKGNTPLHLVIRQNRSLELVREILNFGGDVNSRDKYDYTPIAVALQMTEENDSVIEELLKQGVSVNQTYGNGDTLLHIACKTPKSLNVIQEILNYQPDVNRANEHGETPIFGVCKTSVVVFHKQLEVIKVLLKYGASVLVKNKKNQTPLQFAVRTGQYQIVQEFLKYGADVHNKDLYGMTPLSESANTYLIPRSAIELINYGASVHESFEIDTLLTLKQRDELFVDVLIKYALIEHPDSIHCVYCDKLIHTFPRNVQYYKKEIEKMKNECIVNELTLYDCVIQKCDYGKVFSKQNDILQKRKFEQIQFNIPIYSDVILFRLETRKYLLRNLYDTPTFIKINDKIIHLNACCLQIIARYLSKKDLKNFITAFSEQFYSLFLSSSISLIGLDKDVFDQIPTYYDSEI